MATGAQLSSRGQAWFCTIGLPSDIVIEVDDMDFHLHKKLKRKKNTVTWCSQTFPHGSYTFELAAKFCFGVKIALSSSNVVPLCCGEEFLEMTEQHSKENLISKTKTFLSHSRCVDSIISETLFRWPVSDSASTLLLLHTNGRRSRRNSEDGSWFEELTLLGLPVFKQLILAMKGSELKPEIIETCFMQYTKKHIPGLSRSNRKALALSSSETEQKELLEIVILNLSLKHSTPLRFLFRLLRTATVLIASEACRNVMEKKIGSQLDEVTVDDLLIPSYSYLNETLYDIDCVARILGYFLQKERNVAAVDGLAPRSATLMLVGKLIDGYLLEIAFDANLKPSKFYDFAISVPDLARRFTTAHSWVSKSDREKISRVFDCQKRKLEACMHAAQNERLPLRAVVQVLFFEQLQLRHAIAGMLVVAKEPACHSATMAEEEEMEDDSGTGKRARGR
ncbi:BTB/POZ domain-containing protein [Glycine max]|nr:BTB/POZ domain-containing protein [Glycine max]KAH1267071.1 BTB/POZ domain-containing protein [Glycine max]